jgi:hypothetical protein
MSGMLPLRDTDPREVGGYRLLGRLGEGGQGVVFLALGPAGNRAAVKLLAPTTDPLVRTRFLKEVAAAQQVAGFCTAHVLDAGIFERRPFIVSEYVSGPSLVEVIQQHGPRTGAVLERIAVATLTALGAVHAVGMVHRDFKPGNVLLGPDGPVVIDFGLAAVPGMTTTGLSGQVAVGTPAFMAPEQLAGVRVTAAADMWSWAVTIAYAGTGELPFKGESLTATAYAILHSEPTVGWLPEPLGSIVHRCLSKEPASRPSARGALSELAAAGARLAGPLPPIAPAPAADEGASPAPRAPATVPEPRHDADDAPIDARPTATPQAAATPQPAATPQAAATPQPARGGTDRARWRWRAAAVLASVLLVAGAVGTALVLARSGAPPEQSPGGHAATGQQSGPGLGAAAEARSQAVTWILGDVNRAEVVGCDPQVCAELTNKGFPAGDVSTLGPQSTDPVASGLVVVTPAIQAQFGTRLASVYAPVVIASFGSGTTRIDIRLVFPGGTVRYRAVQQKYLRARKAAETQLLSNSQITFSATAEAQLRRGDIDPRLPVVIAAMAAAHPVQIVDFGGRPPGGGPASLLRWVDLAAVDETAHFPHAAYLRWMHRFANAQRAQYRPAYCQQVTLPGGQAMRIGYDVPSPLS